MKIKHFVTYLTIICFIACTPEAQKINKITGKQININDSLPEYQPIEDFVKPYREHIQTDLNKVLCFNPVYLPHTQENLNTALGNMMADAIYEQANPVFNKIGGKNIDFVLLNFGGIRSTVSAGEVTTKTAYELMPFENNIVVVELPYEALMELENYLITDRKAHPVSSQFHLELDKSGHAKTFTINNKVPDKKSTYRVATSDYLLNGGDNMNFLKNNTGVTPVNYMIRKALIDYFTAIDTIKATIDHRFYQD